MSINTHRWRASAPWSFRDKEYEVSLDLREEKLLVEVEDVETADQWRGSFDSRRKCLYLYMSIYILNTRGYSVHIDIEELTRKTGNFKQFSVFVNMLESAIVKVCIGHTSPWRQFVYLLYIYVYVCFSRLKV